MIVNFTAVGRVHGARKNKKMREADLSQKLRTRGQEEPPRRPKNQKRQEKEEKQEKEQGNTKKEASNLAKGSKTCLFLAQCDEDPKFVPQCHKVPRLPREMHLHNFNNSIFCDISHRQCDRRFFREMHRDMLDATKSHAGLATCICTT